MELDPAELARYFRGAADALAPAVQGAETESVRDVHDRMLFWTNGGESLAELRRDDHPYARRHGASRRHPIRINRQSGALQSSLTVDEPQVDGDGTTAAAYFTAPHGRYLFDAEASDYPDGGTKFMFGRDVPGQIVTELEEARAERFEATIADLFTR